MGKKKGYILKKPLILSLVKKELEKYFWRGCFDTDGSVNPGVIDLSSSDVNILNQSKDYLKTICIEPKIKNIKLVINMLYLKKFKEIGFSHPRKQREFLNILKRGPKHTLIKQNHDNIDKRLLGICDLLRIDNGGYRIRIHIRNLKKKRIDIAKIREIIKDLFGYELKVRKKLIYFKSKKVYGYLKNLFVYEPFWKPINSKEEIQLLNKWNEIWCKNGKNSSCRKRKVPSY